MPPSLSISYGRPIAMTIPHFKVAKGSKGKTTSLFCLNNRMPKKTLICHLFTRTVKWCVDSELFLVKMQKMPNFTHTGKLASRLAGRCNRGKAEKFSSPLLSSLSSQFFYQVHPKLILLSRVKISWRAVIMVSSTTIFSKKVQTLLTILCWNLSCNICSFLIAHIIGEVELQWRFEPNPVEYILTGSPAWDSFKACSSCPCVCDQTNKP